MKHYPRKCDECGMGMDEGYVLHDVQTFCSKECFFDAVWIDYLYKHGLVYWTSWHIEEGETRYTPSGEEVTE